MSSSDDATVGQVSRAPRVPGADRRAHDGATSWRDGVTRSCVERARFKSDLAADTEALGRVVADDIPGDAVLGGVTGVLLGRASGM